MLHGNASLGGDATCKTVLDTYVSSGACTQ
jgi:hypothetical protein